MSKNIFITGATGFLGSYVAAELLRRGHFLYILSRPKGNEGCNERLHRALRLWVDNHAAKRLRIFEGDIESRDLGLAPEDLAQLRDISLEILHCAACTSFGGSSADTTFRTNVEGSKNILDFASRVKATTLHFVSTAYVAGDFAGPFSETDLQVGQGFNNLYEKTKYEAEVIVRDFSRKSQIPVNFFRPSIIMGETDTGKTTNFNTFYSYFNALGSLKRKLEERLNQEEGGLDGSGIVRKDGFLILPLRIAASPRALKNIVPVDFVGQAIAAVVEGESNGIKTFHLTNPDPPTMSWLNSEFNDALGIRGIKLVEEAEITSKQNFFEGIIHRSIKAYRPYLQGEPRFICDATHAHLHSLGVYFPKLPGDYYRRLIEYAEKADYGADQEEPMEKSTALIFIESLEKKVGESIIPNLKSLNACFSIRLADIDKKISLSIKNGILEKLSARNGSDSRFTFVLSSDTLGELIEKKVKPQEAFFEKKIEIEGDMGEALVLAPIFDEFFRSLGSL
ncbi:MAG: SDR family oxidoreductase [Syntrophales bacterium]